MIAWLLFSMAVSPENINGMDSIEGCQLYKALYAPLMIDTK
jgi:hypothetical protein